MLIDQQQKPTWTLQDYVQNFSDLLFKSSGLLPHQAIDLAHITHFIHKFHNQKLQHYVLGKNPTSVQNPITINLTQKKMLNYALLKAYIIMTQNMKLIIFLICNIRIKIVIQDTAMVVVAHF